MAKKVEVKAPKGKTSVSSKDIKNTVKKVVTDKKEVKATKTESKKSLKGQADEKHNPVVESKKSKAKPGKK